MVRIRGCGDKLVRSICVNRPVKPPVDVQGRCYEGKWPREVGWVSFDALDFATSIDNELQPYHIAIF